MSKPGSYRGKHFTSYVEEVEALLAFGRTPEDEARAERTLLSLIDATESEDKCCHMGVAPWYYEALASLYRDQGRRDDEVEVLERFARQRHAPGVMPSQLLTRLERTKRELAGDMDWLVENSDSWQLLAMGKALLAETPPDAMSFEQRLNVLDILRRAYDGASDRYANHKAAILRVIGEVEHATGNQMHALECFRKALALNPKVGVKKLALKLEKELKGRGG